MRGFCNQFFFPLLFLLNNSVFQIINLWFVISWIIHANEAGGWVAEVNKVYIKCAVERLSCCCCVAAAATLLLLLLRCCCSRRRKVAVVCCVMKQPLSHYVDDVCRKGFFFYDMLEGWILCCINLNINRSREAWSVFCLFSLLNH